ncbi:alpha/beta hydrolase [Capnocytophaga sp. H4358]|uniref:alpha/beta fold hydrolase n=1 Tax=Capnocytophaga TaxID=1016 RepID=UPI000BB1AEF0|nr:MULTISPECIES: alpha/beta hydrolase [Capnocytophaga]ATA73588.1 alpha/beta hydrolase [Capnocytophaga sp. H4358]ATA75729.1 alpha/beta hydrolase [Capnocytophaga sp. H2931]GIM62211.1 alpha/beta hydrolase [Capnocytophaga canis]
MKNIPFYTKKGSGKPLMLLHGFLESSEIWEHFAEILQSDFCVITTDLLGHGKTPVEAEIHTMEMMAEAVNRILEIEKIDTCLFVGHSMGGYVSLAFAEKYPEKVNGLILMNSTTVADSEEKKANRLRVLEVIDKDKSFFIRTAVNNLFSSENRIKMKQKVDKVIKIAMEIPNEGIKAASLGMKDRPDRTHIFEGLQVPKHIIIGENDELIPAENLVELAQKTKASYNRLIGGHMSYIENETETVDIIKRIGYEI